MKQYNIFTGEYDLINENGDSYKCRYCKKILNKKKNFCNILCEKNYLKLKYQDSNLDEIDNSQTKLF